MKSVSLSKIYELAAKQLGKWSVFLNNGFDYDDGFDDNPKYVKLEEIRERFQSKHGILINPHLDNFYVFDSEQDAWEFYEEFDKGVLADSEVYAAIISPEKGCVTENT